MSKDDIVQVLCQGERWGKSQNDGALQRTVLLTGSTVSRGIMTKSGTGCVHPSPGTFGSFFLTNFSV